MSRGKKILVGISLIVLLLGSAFWWRIDETRRVAQVGAQAYLYALPLVLMDVTREQTFAHPAAHAATPNRFYHIPVLADHTFRTVIRPNVDTIYSTAWLDISEGPVLLTVPPSDGRYHVIQFMDAWTNVFFAPGVRTLGNEPGQFLIARPEWRGNVPDGYERIDAPTDMLWVIGRIYVEGRGDLEAASRYQRSLDLRPLNELGNESFRAALPDPAGRGVARTDPIDIVKTMEPSAFFERFQALLRTNPPAAADAPFIEETLVPLGLAPEDYAGWAALDRTARRRVELGIQKVWDVMTERAALEKNRTPTGWAGLSIAKLIGDYGTNYELRAGVAVFGLGANIPADAVYLNASVDGGGNALKGGTAYHLTFAPGELPPVHGFWSVTLYDRKGYLIDHTLMRYGLRDSSPLIHNANGSLTLFIQPEAPEGEMVANWLPSPPEGEFVLSMRLYWPKEEALQEDWMPPAIMAQE